jgi:hypothetical protein
MSLMRKNPKKKNLNNKTQEPHQKMRFFFYACRQARVTIVSPELP